MRRLMGRSLKSCVEIVEAELGRKLPDDFVEKMQAVTYQSFRDAPLQPVPGVQRGDRWRSQAAGHRDLRRELGRARQDALSRSASPACGTCFEGRIFSSSQVPRGKPFPDLFLHAAIAMNVQPFDCIVVEDFGAGRRRRRSSAGMRALAYAGAPYADRDALAAAGGVPVRRHEEVARRWCANDRLVVDGRGHARARRRGRRRHGRAGRRAAAARFGLHGDRARGAHRASAAAPGPTTRSARRSISAARGCMASTAIRSPLWCEKLGVELVEIAGRPAADRRPRHGARRATASAGAPSWAARPSRPRSNGRAGRARR